MLEYKPRIRNNKAVTSWVPTHDNKNRGQVSAGTYYSPIPQSGIWTPRSSTLGAVAFNGGSPLYENGVWLGAQEYDFLGTMLFSTDGITWTTKSTGYNSSTISLAYGNGIWVQCAYINGPSVYGYRGLTSTNNGTTWTLRNQIGGSSALAYNIKFINGTFYAIGSNASFPAIWTSTDGINWTQRLTGTQSGGLLYDVAFGNGTFIACGFHQPSTDVAFLYTSTNGTSWTALNTVPAALANRQLRCIEYGGGTWVLASMGGGGTNDNRSIFRSNDNGVNWTNTGLYDLNGWRDIKYAQGLFMATRNSVNGTVSVSSDNGVTWDTQTINIPYAATLSNGNNMWVACGANGNPSLRGISTSVQNNGIEKYGLVLHLDSSNINSYPKTGTNWYDLSGNNNNGSFVRTVTYTNTNGGELNFASKSYSRHENSSSFQFGSVFSIQAWIRPTILSAGNGYTGRYAIFSTRLNGNAGGFTLEVGTNEAGTNRVGVSGVGTWIYRSADNQVALNGWTNVAYVRNGSAQTMYVNGQPISPASTAAYTITNNTAPKTIGIGNIETTEFFGAIPKVYVYNRPLTAAEVNQNYHTTKAQYV